MTTMKDSTFSLCLAFIMVVFICPDTASAKDAVSTALFGALAGCAFLQLARSLDKWRAP